MDKPDLKLVEGNVAAMLESLNIAWGDDPHMKDTPARVARAYRELFAGLYDEEPRITLFPNTDGYNEMMFLGPIDLRSICAHHLLPFFGSVFIGYLPKGTIVGVSKLVRIVNWIAARPQLQENLTQQIANYLQSKLDPIGVAVYVEATHTCMTMRGVKESSESKMKTSALKGLMYESTARNEFFSMVARSSK